MTDEPTDKFPALSDCVALPEGDLRLVGIQLDQSADQADAIQTHLAQCLRWGKPIPSD